MILNEHVHPDQASNFVRLHLLALGSCYRFRYYLLPLNHRLDSPFGRRLVQSLELLSVLRVLPVQQQLQFLLNAKRFIKLIIAKEERNDMVLD